MATVEFITRVLDVYADVAEGAGQAGSPEAGEVDLPLVGRDPSVSNYGSLVVRKVLSFRP